MESDKPEVHVSCCTVGLACLLTIATGCDRDIRQPPSSGGTDETHDRQRPRTSPSPDDSSIEKSPPELPDVQKLEICESVQGQLATPSTLDELDFETDWYELHVDTHETIRYRLEATDEQGLRPMITILLVEGRRSNWRALTVRRADRSESTLKGTVNIEPDGSKLIAIDDVRNIDRNEAGEARTPGSYLGGEAFGYRLKVTRD